MKKWHFFIWGLILIATVLGVYGQSLAYFVDENIAITIYPVYSLTILTAISILLYLVTPLLIYSLAKVKKIDKKYTDH